MKKFFLVLVLTFIPCLHAQDVTPLEGTQPLTEQADFSDRMLAGMEKLLLRETEQSIAGRTALWHRDFSSRQAYEKSIESNRAHFAHIIGVVDPRRSVS